MAEPGSYSEDIARAYDLIVEADGSGECGGDELEFVLNALRGHSGRAVREVLDAGCGTGRHLLPLVRKGFSVTGLDHSPGMLAQCRRKLQAAGLSAELTEARLEDLDCRCRFDAAICMNSVICYLLETERILDALRRLHRALRPGGLLLIDNWNFFAQWDRFGYPMSDVRENGGLRVEYEDRQWLDDFASVYHVQIDATVREGDRTWEIHHHDELRAMTVGEMRLYLRDTGFEDVRALPSFDPAEADEPCGQRMIFLAGRPEKSPAEGGDAPA
jgi:SAM-dependent methyltransferase